MTEVDIGKPLKRSSGALKSRRVPLPWPQGRDFRILSIDGGGIRGIFPAAFLAGLEDRYLHGKSVARYFDLIAGTSTGGIIALGLSAGYKASELRDLYIFRGSEIFPPIQSGLFGEAERQIRMISQFFKFRFDRKALDRILFEKFGNRKLFEAHTRLCIPSFEGHYGEVYIFKTPHHPDFQKDKKELYTKVAAATSAAPAFFQPLKDGAYTFIDGGVWANNPIMIALVDILTCFSIPRERVSILSLGCGDTHYVVDNRKISRGGFWYWRDIIYAAMKLQSNNALGQAGLLIGANKIVRANPPPTEEKIHLDDWSRAVAKLPGAAEIVLNEIGNKVASEFLSEEAGQYKPMH